ncbi:MAG: ABC transporter permease [Bacteroidia bacterium]
MAGGVGRWLLRSGLRAAAIFFVSFTLLFLFLRALGDPAQMLLGQRSDKATLEAVIRRLHLDEPLWKQYLLAWHSWLPYREGKWQLPDLGESYQYGRSVLELYLEYFPATLLLGSAAMALAALLGVGGGLYCAYRPQPFWNTLTIFLLALPGYVVGVGLLALVALVDLPLPLGGYIRTYDPLREQLVYQWEALFLPALALALRPAAYLFQLTLHQAQSLLQADFVRTAYAKGKTPGQVLRSDILRNLLPVLATSLSQWLAGLFIGALFIEEVFDWPGVGKLFFSALMSSDYPLVLGIAQISTLLFVGLHLTGELVAGWSDPRLRTGL